MKLTPEWRKAFFAGEWPRITFPGDEPCPVEVGDYTKLSDALDFTVTAVVRTKAGEWRVDYNVRDFRPRFPKHVPSTDEKTLREAVKPPTAEEIKRASEHGNYTSSIRDAVPDVGDSVPHEYQKSLSTAARSRFIERRRSETEAQRERERDLHAVNAELRELIRRATKMGVDPVSVLGPVAREIANQHANLRDQAA